MGIEAVANRLIAMYAFARHSSPEFEFPGDLVVDPFCGTGATCAAAKGLGRRFIGIDLGPDFTVEAARRVRAAVRHGTVFLCQDGRLSDGPGIDAGTSALPV